MRTTYGNPPDSVEEALIR